MANRLKRLLEHVISENQSVFMSERLITDHVMVAYEVIHFLKRKRKGRNIFMALKLVMSKTYDIIKWSYLKVILIKMG